MFQIVSEMEIVQCFTHSSGTLEEACKIAHGEHHILTITAELSMNNGLLARLGHYLEPCQTHAFPNK